MRSPTFWFRTVVVSPLMFLTPRQFSSILISDGVLPTPYVGVLILELPLTISPFTGNNETGETPPKTQVKLKSYTLRGIKRNVTPIGKPSS